MMRAPSPIFSRTRYVTQFELVDGEAVGVTFDLEDWSPRADMLRNVDLAQVRGYITAEQCAQAYRDVNAACDERGRLLPVRGH